MRIEDQIINFMLNIDRDTTPREIASNIKRNPNSVRSQISKLLRKGTIKKIRHGVYSIIEGYGVWGRSIPIRFQNLNFEGFSAVVEIDKGAVDIFEFPDINGDMFRIRVSYGFTHKRITWTIKAPIGLDYYGLKLAIRLVDCMIASRGYSEVSWIIGKGGWETLQDHMGLRIEGLAKSVTIDDFMGNLLKIYQKSYGVRIEVRSSHMTDLNTLLALSSGGMPQAQLMQGIHQTNTVINDLGTAIKYRNIDDHNRDKILQALASTVVRMNEKLDSIAKNLKSGEFNNVME